MEAMRHQARRIRGGTLERLDHYLARFEQEALNNGNQVAGAGSYGFTDELPGNGRSGSDRITTGDLWANFNAQSVIGISPQMYGEFFFPCYRELAEMFGLTYYGCCEPVHAIWDDWISRLPRLRKVSVSA